VRGVSTLLRQCCLRLAELPGQILAPYWLVIASRRCALGWHGLASISWGICIEVWHVGVSTCGIPCSALLKLRSLPALQTKFCLPGIGLNCCRKRRCPLLAICALWAVPMALHAFGLYQWLSVLIHPLCHAFFCGVYACCGFVCDTSRQALPHLGVVLFEVGLLQGCGGADKQ